jgi:group I intron endonuclease
MLVYGLVDPHTKEVRYVGKQGGKSSRFTQHMKPSTYTKRSGHVYSWIRHLVENGVEPKQVILAECSTQEELNEAEKAFIAYFRGTSNRLCNHTDGGDGAPGYKASEETKAKLRSAQLGKKHSEETKSRLRAMRQGEDHPMWGVKASDLCKQKVKEANSRSVYCSNGKVYHSCTEAAKDLGIANSGICRAASGQKSHCAGYGFSYTDSNISSPQNAKINHKIESVVRNDGLVFESVKEAALKSGVSRQAVANVLYGLARTCGKNKYSFVLKRIGG